MHLTAVAPAHIKQPHLRGATVEIKYDGRPRDIDSAHVHELGFERLQPVRMSKAYPGRKHYSGVYWARTTGRHHWFESLYEKSALTALDRDPTVVEIATQPFKLSWAALGRFHFPDVLARRGDGSMLVVDVRPRERIHHRDEEVFAITSAWAAMLGLDYRLFADLTKVQDWNLRLLAGYRYERWKCTAAVADALDAHRGEVRTLEDWTPLFEGTAAPPRGLLLAAIWHGALDVELSTRLEFTATAICTGRGWE